MRTWIYFPRSVLHTFKPRLGEETTPQTEQISNIIFSLASHLHVRGSQSCLFYTTNTVRPPDF